MFEQTSSVGQDEFYGNLRSFSKSGGTVKIESFPSWLLKKAWAKKMLSCCHVIRKVLGLNLQSCLEVIIFLSEYLTDRKHSSRTKQAAQQLNNI